MENLCRLRVRGNYACFTRPELKVERVSYPIITPPAAMGILSSILWKPEMRWIVKRIYLLAPIQFWNCKRNECKSKMPMFVKEDLEKGIIPRSLDTKENRTQRNSLLLRNVDYAIDASIKVIESKHPVEVYLEMFHSRLSKGQIKTHPFLGCREFPARLSHYDGNPAPIPHTQDFGKMSLQVWGPLTHVFEPVFFSAYMQNGILDVPVLRAQSTGEDNVN